MDLQEQMDRRALALAPGIRTPRVTITHDGSMTLTHPMLSGTGYEATGIVAAVDAAGVVTTAALREFDDLVKDIRRRDRREEVFDRIDGEMDPERPWTEIDRPPAWATLTHPLFSYALKMNGTNDLTGPELAAGTSRSKGVRLELVQDVVIGRAMLDPTHPAAGKVGCDVRGASLLLEADIPETTRHLLAGRALGALLQLRTCGDAHLDAIVSAIPILHVNPPVDGSPVVTVTMAPVPWVPPAEAPHGIDVTDLRRDAPIR